MIEKIIEFSIRNRFIVIMAALGVVVWGVYAVINTPVDAIPDLSENQVIVFTDWMGRSPREIEDQITYPLSVNLQGLAGVKAVRSSSEFNFSMINIIFEDNVDFYFARQRVLERLTLASTFLPPGVVPYMAPDATALGQIFWYTVEGPKATTWAGCGPCRIGTSATSSTRSPAWPRSPPWAATRSSTRSTSIRNKLRAYGVTLGELYCGRGPLQFVGRRPGDPEGQRRVPGPRRGLDRSSTTSNTSSSSRTRQRARRSVWRTWPRSAGARSSAAACWKRTATRRSAPW